MRIISAASLAVLQQTSGVKPIIVVRVYWGGSTYTNYCDRKFANDGLVGKLLQISGIEDIVDINQNASSVELQVLLDDTDGSIKAIYDNNDIHKTYVQVLQWFQGLPFSDAFVIFEGEIASPITWSEGARTLAFNVLTRLESTEVGFAVEEGQFAFFPSDLAGQAWPVVFGQVAGVSMLSITDPASAVLASGFGIVDHDVWEAELADLSDAIAEALDKEREAYQLHLNNAFIAGAFKPFGGFLPDDPDQAEQYDNAAQQYLEQANQYAEERLALQLELQQKQAEYEEQQALEFRVLPITATNLPTGLPITVEIDNYTANALVIDRQIILTNLVEKPDVNQKIGTNAYGFGTKLDTYNREDRGQKFVWIDGGTEVKVFGLPRHYIASLGLVTVVNVWAQNKYGRSVVPSNWYTVVPVNYNGMLATKVIFPTPITSYPGEWQDGDIQIDCISAIQPNAVDIMLWAITNYSTLAYDATSFNYVRTKVAPFPMNFALTERKNIVQFLQEIAFQARCAIWINDRKFFLRFLPEALAPVETLADNDIEVDSVTVTSTDTERLVTKFVAEWRANSFQSDPNKIIFRYNIQKYGLHEETYDFYAYNNQACVEVAAQFWMIRKSSTWKYVNCKALLHKLRIETFDPVQFTFTENLVANGPVTGIIEKATFNPDDDTIEIMAWLPVRLGEMTEYQYAYPFDKQVIYPNASDGNIRTGNPFEDAGGELVPEYLIPSYKAITYSRGNPFTQGRGEVVADAAFETPGSVVTALNPRQVNLSRPNGLSAFNNEKKYTIKPITPFDFKQATPGSFYGVVVAQGESEEGEEDSQVYSANVFLKGLDEEPTLVETVKIPMLDSDEVLPPGYPLEVHRNVYVSSEDQSVTLEFWAQPAIWYESES
jgi:hypothetical protein